MHCGLHYRRLHRQRLCHRGGIRDGYLQGHRSLAHAEHCRNRKRPTICGEGCTAQAPLGLTEQIEGELQMVADLQVFCSPGYRGIQLPSTSEKLQNTAGRPSCTEPNRNWTAARKSSLLVPESLYYVRWWGVRPLSQT